MFRTRRKILSILIVMILVMIGVGSMSRPVLAEDANVVIWFSSDSVSKGDSVSVVVDVSGDAISAMTMDVSYSSDILEFTGASGMANGGGGNVRVSFTGPGSITLNFTAVANGTAYISTSGGECYDINLNPLSVADASASLTVSTPEATTEKKTEANKKDDPSNENTEEKKDDRSSNCSLASLSVSPGNLSPAFSGDNTSYYVEVDKDTSSLIVSATPEDSKAETYVTGAESLQPGLNTVKVNVTAENGAVRVYTITVQCGDEKDPYQVVIDGATWTIERSLDIEAPEGFTAGKTNFKGEEIDCLVSPSGKITILPLSNEEETAWFIFDAKNTKFTPYVEYSAAFARFLILEPGDGVKVPGGFQPVEIKIGEQKVKAYTDGSDEGIYLIYAVNVDKKDAAEGFYLYDSREDTYMRFPGMLVQEKETVTTEEAPTEKTATPAEAPKIQPAEPETVHEDEGFLSRNMLKLICGILAMLFVLLAIILIIMIVRINKLKNRLDDKQDDEFGDEDEDEDFPGEEQKRVRMSYRDQMPEEPAEESPEEKTEVQEDAPVKSQVNPDTGEILLEIAEDNNSSVQIDPVEDVNDRIREAMKERPFGIDSAFDVVADDTMQIEEPEESEPTVVISRENARTAAQEAAQAEAVHATASSQEAAQAEAVHATASSQEAAQAEAVHATASSQEAAQAEAEMSRAAEEARETVKAAEETAPKVLLPGDFEEEQE